MHDAWRSNAHRAVPFVWRRNGSKPQADCAAGAPLLSSSAWAAPALQPISGILTCAVPCGTKLLQQQFKLQLVWEALHTALNAGGVAAHASLMQGKAGDGVAVEGVDADAGAREEADSRSIYVGNVDWGCTPEELQQHFANCGTVNRVTILTDRFGNPKVSWGRLTD